MPARRVVVKPVSSEANEETVPLEADVPAKLFTGADEELRKKLQRRLRRCGERRSSPGGASDFESPVSVGPRKSRACIALVSRRANSSGMLPSATNQRQHRAPDDV